MNTDDTDRCFAPAVTPDIRLLILGSLPGKRSLAKQQYYGHPRNQFWRLMSERLNIDLISMDYEERLYSLNAHAIGLWDVVARAKRPGSLDQNMRDVEANPLLMFIRQFSGLEAIGFNGSAAAHIGQRQLGPAPLNAAGLPLSLIALPSSSPAHTLAYAHKNSAWAALEPYMDQTALSDDTPRNMGHIRR